MINNAMASLPNGFTRLDHPEIFVELMYAGDINFIGRPIAGYYTNIGIITIQASKALNLAQTELDEKYPGYHLLVKDAYRPQDAVADFVTWSEDPSDQMNKLQYYPNIDKKDLFTEGYIAKQSGHSRGSTLDLTLVKRNSEGDYSEVDMGTRIDFMDETAHTATPHISHNSHNNRQLLKTIMNNAGFENYPKEWWHYTLVVEPFPDTYFNFQIR